MLRALVRIGLIVSCGLALQGCDAWSSELHSQRELSRVAGQFAPSRYLTYERSDASHHHFRERGKFGVLGPSGRFSIARKLIDFEPPPAGSLVTYDQNSGTFELSGRGHRISIKADFQETQTAEEERYGKSVQRLAEARSSGNREAIRGAEKEAMFASRGVGRLDETLRHAGFLIDVQDPDHAHTALQIVGSIALARGDRGEAKARLLASAQIRPSAVMRSFGPTMGLAQELLDAGEAAAVLEYLEACKTFWKPDVLAGWQAQVREGKPPRFGANLHYGMH